MLAVQLGLRTEALVSIAAPSRFLDVLRGFTQMVGLPARARVQLLSFAGAPDDAPERPSCTIAPVGSFPGPDGNPRSLHLNGVSVTPLLPLRFGKDHDYVDRITNIVRVAKSQ